MLVDHIQFKKKFHMDKRLNENLHFVRQIVTKKDFDWVFLICGKERFGKSTFAQQLAYVCADSKLHMNDVCLTFDEFHKRVRFHIEHNNKGRSVIYDETMGVADTRSFNNIYSRGLRKLLAECGQANLHLFILLPSFFDLDRPIALHRSNTLFRVEVNRKNYNRGRWYMYNEKKKEKMYLKNKKTYSYKGKANLHGTYSSFYCVDEVAYRKKKSDTLRRDDDTMNQVTPRITKLISQRDTLVKYIFETNKLTKTKIAEMVGVSSRGIGLIINPRTPNKGLFPKDLRFEE